MCGFAGILNLDGEPVSAVLLQRMTDAVAHRGPDGEGSFVDGAFGVGHRRLAIIDLSQAGRQPMATEDGRFVIAYNGEVYNFRELRVELAARGRRFRSETDSEVVLNAYAEWGPGCFERLNGMFAFAVFDRRERKLLLARDRYGVKPLYYRLTDRTLLFGSEVKALLAHPGCPAAIDLEALPEYLTFQNFFGTRTLFKGVELLSPASWLAVVPGGTAPTKIRYWDFEFLEPEGVADETALQEELRRLLRQAVRRQLVSDVEVGAYLSGGIDSGSITALAAQDLPYIRTFTAGFDLTSASGIELGFDERAAAEHMSYLFRTEHYEMVLKAGDMERILPQLAWHIEEPRIGQSYPNFYVARLASRFCKVVLSGAGGDELFGGYPWRYYRAAVNNDFDHYIDKYFSFWQRVVPAEALADVLAPVWSQVRHVSPREVFRSVFGEHRPALGAPEEYINQSLYFEAKTFLHSLLIVEDKLSMAHGLETRVPFLDNDLVSFAMRVPVRLRLGNLGEVVRLNENEPGPKTARYFAETRDGKLLLRRAMSGQIPALVTHAEKRGFSAPDASWFKGESIDYVRRLVFDDDARIYEYLDRRAVRGLVDDHFAGRVNRRLLIWSLLSLEAFCRAFL